MENEAIHDSDGDCAKYDSYIDDSSTPLNRNLSGGRTNENFKQTTPSPSPSKENRRSNAHKSDCPLNENKRKTSNGSPTCKLYVKSRQTDKAQVYDKNIILNTNREYLRKCDGIVKLIQIILSSVTLIMLVTTGRHDGGLLHLPLSWHYRVMLFVLILTILTSVLLVIGHITNFISLLPIDWILFDLVLYSVFAFLYLVGTSLVASAFDFYDKMNSNVSQMTLNQLVICIVLGYVCMLCYGLTAVGSYRMWKIQYNLYQRKRLIEEEEFDI